MKTSITYRIFDFLGVALIVAAALYFISNMEPSIKPIPQRMLTDEKHRLPVYLISYASGEETFFQNRNLLVTSSLDKGFDYFLNYGPHQIDHSFYKKNKEILSVHRGGGLWLWKPYIIKKTMQAAPENAIIIYSDSGFMFTAPIYNLIEKFKEKDVLLLHYEKTEIEGTLSYITPRTVLKHFNIDTPEYRNAPHLWAGMVMVKNTPKARAFIDKWLAMCENIDLIKPQINTTSLPEYPEFRWHQDDETLLTVLYAIGNRDGIGLIPTEEISQYIIWHHRRPGNSVPVYVLYLCTELVNKVTSLFTK